MHTCLLNAYIEVSYQAEQIIGDQSFIGMEDSEAEWQKNGVYADHECS